MKRTCDVLILGRGKLGVATCLILEKQRHLAASMDEKVAPPKGPLVVVVVCCG